MSGANWQEQLEQKYEACLASLRAASCLAFVPGVISTLTKADEWETVLAFQGQQNNSAERLQGLLAIYLELFELKGGVIVAHTEAAAFVRDASRYLRDAVVSSAYGLMQTDRKAELVYLLDELSGNKIEDPSTDGQNLKSSLLKAYHALYGNLQEDPFKPRRSRGKRSRPRQGAQVMLGNESMAASSDQMVPSTAAIEDVPASSNQVPSSMAAIQDVAASHEAVAAMVLLATHQDKNVRKAIDAVLKGLKSGACDTSAFREVEVTDYEGAVSDINDETSDEELVPPGLMPWDQESDDEMSEDEVLVPIGLIQWR